MARPHITLNDELDNRIKEYANIKHVKYSKAIEELVNYGFTHLEDKKNYEVQISLFEKILGKEKYITLILEQLYSDMYMEAKTNPNDNTGLKIIKNRIFKRDFYD